MVCYKIQNKAKYGSLISLQMTWLLFDETYIIILMRLMSTITKNYFLT